MDNSTDNYTVKEMLSLVVIPALEDLKAQASDRNKDVDDRLSSLEAWRNKGIGIVAFIIAILVPVSIPVILTVLSGVHK